MTENALQLAARYYRALPIDRPGYEQVTLSLPVDKTALVGMHCWNIGCPDGPPVDVDYCVGMGWPQSTEEAGRIMAEVIRPAMDAARAIGMPVCHVETDWMDHQYPHIESRRSGESGAVHPHQQEMLERAHGIGYMERSPLAQMRRAEIVSPVGDEPLFFYSDVLDEYLRTPRRGYTHLHGIRSRHVPTRCRGGSAAHASARLSLRGDARCDRRGGDARIVPPTAIDQLRPPHLRVEPGLRLHLRTIPTSHRSDER